MEFRKLIFIIGLIVAMCFSSAWAEEDYIEVDNGTVLDNETTLDNATMGLLKLTPRTLNLKSKGKWITARIQPPEGYTVKDIDVESILLEDAFEPERTKVSRKFLIAKFNRRDLAEFIGLMDIELPGLVDLTITGKITSDNSSFVAIDTVIAISPGNN